MANTQSAEKEQSGQPTDVVQARGERLSPVAGDWTQLAVFGAVFLVACAVFFTGLGRFPLFNPDEGLFAEPAREILDTGEWVTSLLNYVVRYTKPPLVMWAMALSYDVFGVNEFAARFVCAGSAALLVACTYCFLARYAGTRAAVLGCGTLLVAPLFVGTARMAITDMPLSLLLSAAMMSFYRAFAERARLWRWLAYALVGLAVMTKGPVAVVLPAIILFAYHLLRGSLREAFGFYKPLWGALVVGAISIPWFAIEIARTKGAYFQEFIMRENFQRFTGDVDSHKHGWWYHLLAMMGGYFPWSVFVPQAVYRSLRPEGSKPWLARMRDVTPGQDLCLYATCWSMITLVFFSVSVSKLLTYTLPAFAALAILVALEIDDALKSRSHLRLLVPLSGLAIVYGIAGIGGPIALHRLRNCPPDLNAILTGHVAVQCVIVLMALALYLARRPVAAISSFAFLTLVSSGLAGYKTLASVSDCWEGPLPDMERYAAASSDPIIVFDMRKPGAPFYTRRQVINAADKVALQARLSALGRAYIITRASNRDYLSGIGGCRVVTQRGSFLLVSWRRLPA